MGMPQENDTPSVGSAVDALASANRGELEKERLRLVDKREQIDLRLSLINRMLDAMIPENSANPVPWRD